MTGNLVGRANEVVCQAGAEADQQTMTKLYSLATLDAFGGYGMVLLASGRVEPPPAEEVGMVLRYSSEQLAGAVILSASSATWCTLLQPDLVSVGSEELLQDCVGELANMLIGNMKRSLLRRGIAIQLATPTRPRTHQWGTTAWKWQAFTRGDLSVYLGTSDVFAPLYELAAESVPSGFPCADEVLLF